MVTLISNIAQGQQGVSRNLPLHREHVVVEEWNSITVIEEGVCGKRQKVGPVHRGVWIGSRDVVRGKGKGEPLPVVEAGGGSYEGSSEQGWPGAEVIETEGGNGVHDAGRQARECGVEEAVARSNTALSAVSEDGRQQPPIEFWRI